MYTQSKQLFKFKGFFFDKVYKMIFLKEIYQLKKI